MVSPYFSTSLSFAVVDSVCKLLSMFCTI